MIDYRVNLVMPYHKLFDGAHEAWKGKRATGSVRVGIGYCYEDRNNRSGIRCEDLFYPEILRKKVATLWPLKKAILEKEKEQLQLATNMLEIIKEKIILEEDTKKSKDARDNMRDIDGKPIKNVIKDMATALSGKEQENPIEFLEQRITKALTSEASMNQLAEELVEIKVLKEGDKKKFLEDMTLGLSWSDHVAISKKVGGNIFMMMMSLSGLLAYVAAQKLREGGGMQG